MKVLHVVNQLELGGTEKTAQLFCKYLNKIGVETTLFSFRDGIRKKICEEEGIRVVIGIPDLCRLLSEEAFDIVHLHRGGWCDDTFFDIYFSYDQDAKFVETNIFGEIDRGRYSNQIHRHLFVSDYIKRWYIKAHMEGETYDDSKLHVLYNPIEKPELVESKFHCIESFYEKMELDPQRHILIGRIGRADNYHGISCDAFDHIAQNNKELYSRLAFIAIAPPIELHKRMQGYVRYRCMDQILTNQELDEFMYSIKVLCHDRVDGETFGCGIAEAMMRGTPTITHVSRKYFAQYETMRGDTSKNQKFIEGGVDKLKIKDGIKELKAGCIVNRDDYRSYAQAITSICSRELSSEMRRWMTSYAAENYEASVIAEQLKNHYEEILS